MYLVGELGDREYFKGMGMVKLKKEITKEDLGKTLGNSDFQVINLNEQTYFDPDKNDWVSFDS